MEILNGKETYTLLNGEIISHEVSDKLIETATSALYIVECWFTEAEKIRLDALKWSVVDLKIVGIENIPKGKWSLMAIETESTVNEIVTIKIIFSLNK